MDGIVHPGDLGVFAAACHDLLVHAVDRSDIVPVEIFSGRGGDEHRDAVRVGNDVDVQVIGAGKVRHVLLEILLIMIQIGSGQLLCDHLCLIGLHGTIKIVQEQDLKRPQKDHQESREQNEVHEGFELDAF